MATLYFTYPEYCILLIAIPLLVITHIYMFRFTKKKAMRFANYETLKRIDGKTFFTRNYFVLFLRILTFSAIILALSQPVVWYFADRETTQYIITIDASASMVATDLEPSRLEAAKLGAIAFLEDLNATASVGVVSFAGTPKIVQIPTTDKPSVRAAIESIEAAPASGTDIGSALITSTNLLLSSQKGRVILLFTDGTSTAGTHIDDPVLEGVGYAKKNEVIVHAFGVGTNTVVPAGYLPSIYNVTAVYNEDELIYITNQTGGMYQHASYTDELLTLVHQVQGETDSDLHSRQLAPGLLFAALFFLFVEWGATNTRFRLIP